MPDLRSALTQHFGHTSFRDGQERVIATLLEGRSALAIFPDRCYLIGRSANNGLTELPNVRPLEAHDTR